MKYKNLRFNLLIGLFLVLAGLLISSPHFVQQWQQRNAQPFFSGAAASAATPRPENAIKGTPNHIELPAVGISLEVIPGYYNKTTQAWTLSNTQAMYATVTAPANNHDGNTFIYGHNKPAVFYKLLQIKVGDQAIVTTSNGHRFAYKMVSRRDVKPNDGSLFTYQGPPILTLQTCSGFWYQNRSLFVFDLVEAK